MASQVHTGITEQQDHRLGEHVGKPSPCKFYAIVQEEFTFYEYLKMMYYLVIGVEKSPLRCHSSGDPAYEELRQLFAVNENKQEIEGTLIVLSDCAGRGPFV